jgi:hypothetical protein
MAKTIAEDIRLSYPHESIETLEHNSGVTQTTYEYVQFARFLRLQRFHILTPESRSWSFSVANGEIGADIFPNKQRFNDFVHELGYEAPYSVMVDPSSPESDILEQITNLDPKISERFCKPVNASRGRGAVLLPDSQAAFDFTANTTEPYLVQTYERPDNDWRYILHYTAEQLASGRDSAWHIIIKVTQPSVVGDGYSTISELVDNISGMSDGAKHYYSKHHRDELKIVPANNEVLKLVDTGNRERGAFGQEHSQTEQDNLDRFMLNFVSDAERKLGTTLATLCFDLGARDAEVLKRPYDFEEIKKNIVFYEHQFPFGLNPYLSSFPDSLKKSGVDYFLPTKLDRLYLEGKAYTTIIRSVIRSGLYLRRAS